MRFGEWRSRYLNAGPQHKNRHVGHEKNSASNVCFQSLKIRVDYQAVIYPLWEKKKYKAHILKYVPCILKYLRHIFCFLWAGSRNDRQKRLFFRSTYFYKGTSTGKGCLVRSFPMLCDWWKTGVRFSFKKLAAHSFSYWLTDDIDLLLCLCLMWNSLIYSCISLFCALWYWILHLTFL